MVRAAPGGGQGREFALDDLDLILFVNESNAIEGIWDPPYGVGTPEFEDHVDAARRVAAGTLTDFFDIHYVITHRILGPAQAGVARMVDVRVGSHHPPEAGPHLRAHLRRLAAMLAAGPVRGESALDFAWRMHDEFESVHPFVDGNGRTGRLLLNALRLRDGLPWATVYEARKQDYYRTIRVYQEKDFRCGPVGSDYSVCEES